MVGGKRILMMIFKRKQSKINSTGYTRYKYYLNNKIKILVYAKYQTHHQFIWYPNTIHTF